MRTTWLWWSGEHLGRTPEICPALYEDMLGKCFHNVTNGSSKKGSNKAEAAVATLKNNSNNKAVMQPSKFVVITHITTYALTLLRVIPPRRPLWLFDSFF
jgi:hypothetical protein